MGNLGLSEISDAYGMSRAVLAPGMNISGRILRNLIGGWVEDGEYPDDEEAQKLIEDIL